MSLLAPLIENPWCLVALVAMTMLIVTAAAIVAFAERGRPVVAGFPPTSYPTRHLAASAPLEGLAALQARLLELLHDLPPGSDDARWLRAYLGRLRQVMDAAYSRLEAAPPASQAILLGRLAAEVEALAGVINLQLGTVPVPGADRQGLEVQLEALRGVVEV